MKNTIGYQIRRKSFGSLLDGRSIIEGGYAAIWRQSRPENQFLRAQEQIGGAMRSAMNSLKNSPEYDKARAKKQ